MRLRWIVIPVVFVFSVIGVYTVCHQTGGAVDTVVNMARRVTFGALTGVGFWAASHVLQHWMSQSNRPVLTGGSPRAASNLPPAPPLPEYAPPTPAGPGKYLVRGRDADTRFEISEVVFADSPSNAQLKVELKGVQVAAVERAG